MLKLLGYSGAYSVTLGENLSIHVSAEDDQDYEARLVRVICGDANPDGPGLIYEEIESNIDGIYKGRKQTTDAGSYMRAPAPGLSGRQAFTFAAMIWPTLLKRGNQTIMSWEAQSAGLRVFLDSGGVLAAECRVGTRTETIRIVDLPLLERQWYAIGLAVDFANGRWQLFQEPLLDYPMITDRGQASAALVLPPLAIEAPVYLAGRATETGIHAHFDGKIDAPAFLAGLHGVEIYRGLLHKHPQHAEQTTCLAQWDFCLGIDGTRTVDISPFAHHGTLFQAPTRGMKGWNWDGSCHSWAQDSAQYGAIHFHHDDLYDANWDVSFVLTIPRALKSGAYAVRVKSGENDRQATREYYIPFFVRPERRAPIVPGRRNKVAFLAPTMSYLAYANHAAHITGREAERNIGRLLEFGHCDLYLHEHPELGGSLYDKHADGSGVCYSSRLRPSLNFTSQYHSWLGGHGSSVWQYNADTHLLAWLEQNGFEYDVITDEDLHHEGVHLLEDYRVVITGTHPEYYSTSMWEGLKNWTEGGGRLMYLGANGFYWHVAFNAEMPGLIEVRRAEDGTRTWEAEPGEYYHSSTGELSGLFRRRGHPPNEICGVGFIAQGFDICSYYRRAPDSRNPRAAFIFEGAEDEIIGDFGLVGGGAAGLELDCMNERLGTPPNALRLASSENHSQQVLVVNEEFGVVPPNLGGDQNDRVRADLVFYETRAGGAVFSTGSISWCGSLLWNGGQNNVSQITRNVLLRFMDEAKFA